jgi:hypothetical protein
MTAMTSQTPCWADRNTSEVESTGRFDAAGFALQANNG